MPCDAIKRKCFLDNTDKDEVQRIRHKEDYELKQIQGSFFPSYDPDVVLESFTERDEKVNRKFFSSKWEKIKQNIIGQTMWVVCIYVIFYYLVQVLFVQSAVNACTWFGDSPQLGSDPNVLRTCNGTLINQEFGKCACAKKFARFVQSWESKQKR